MSLRVPAALLALCCAVFPASAQVCLGLPDNTSAPINIATAASFPDGGTVGGARLGVGGPMAFAGAQVGFVSSDALNKTAPAFAADGGLSVPLGPGSARLCPVVSGTFRYGPQVGDVLLNGVSGTFGLRIGGSIPVTPSFAVITYLGGAGAYLREEAKQGTEVAVVSDAGGFVVGGFGLQFAKVFTIGPTVSIPFGFVDTRATFGIQAGVGFGGVR